MKKSCSMCGRVLNIEDWYAFIRTKYCDSCAKEMRRIQNANRMREFRRLAKEKARMHETLCKVQREEIERLRAEIISLREHSA